jgi:type IV secretion system protein TrbI
VNNHYGRLIGGALAVSVLSAGVQLSQPQSVNGQNITTGQTVAAGLGQQMSQLGTEVTRKNLNVAPILQIRPGYRFTIVLTKDVLLPVWKGQKSPL